MRLVCPNCDAEYEVDDAAVPKEGRDVQCSNCGHAWFQVHPEIEAEQEAETELYDAPPGTIAPAAEQMPQAAAEAAPDPAAAAAAAVARPATRPPTRLVGQPEPDHDDADLADEGGPVGADLPPPRSRTLDETVLAVLREEAERESTARQTELVSQPTLESQTEMPLAPPAQDQGGMAAAVRRIARMRGMAAEPAAATDTDADAAPEPAPKSRGDMFPAIEEINSTLRATGDRAQDQDDAIVDSLPDLTRKGGGFRRGFLTLVLLGVLIAVLYAFAPIIGAKVPALDGVAKAYVVGIDAARVWLDVTLRSLVTTLRGLAGGQGG